jgi:hypothetical protein
MTLDVSDGLSTTRRARLNVRSDQQAAHCINNTNIGTEEEALRVNQKQVHDTIDMFFVALMAGALLPDVTSK